MDRDNCGSTSHYKTSKSCELKKYSPCFRAILFKTNSEGVLLPELRDEAECLSRDEVELLVPDDQDNSNEVRCCDDQSVGADSWRTLFRILHLVQLGNLIHRLSEIVRGRIPTVKLDQRGINRDFEARLRLGTGRHISPLVGGLIIGCV